MHPPSAIPALVLSPGILLADEVTGELDTESGRLVLDLLSRLNRPKAIKRAAESGIISRTWRPWRPPFENLRAKAVTLRVRQYERERGLIARYVRHAVTKNFETYSPFSPGSHTSATMIPR